MKALGPVVYAIRLDDDIIKIGLTGNLMNRLSTVRCRAKSTTGELLAFIPGDESDEAVLHTQLRTHLAHGREYYRPTPEVMAVVNEMRRQLGLRPL